MNDDEFTKEWHDCVHPLHIPYTKGHYCTDWDDLYICEHCAEFECCSCYYREKIMSGGGSVMAGMQSYAISNEEFVNSLNNILKKTEEQMADLRRLKELLEKQPDLREIIFILHRYNLRFPL